MQFDLALRFEYGSAVPWVTRLNRDSGILAIAGPAQVVLKSDVKLHGRGMTTVSSFTAEAGKRREMKVRAAHGTRIGNPVTGELTYSPPEGRDVITEKLTAWERFVHADDGLDPLVRMAAAHYQFEAIHPFTDGNGRTSGRD